MKRPRLSSSTRPSPCEMVSSARSYTRGQPADGPVGQPRQLPAVALGQVPLGGADLLFDQVDSCPAATRPPATPAGWPGREP